MPNAKTRVLVVDDDEAIREVLASRLRGWGYAVSLAASGEEGERLAAAEHPALVVSDVVMPDLGGIELLTRLKAGDPHRPVILITAHGTVEAAVEAIKEGALDFLTKPLDPDKLKAVLAAAEREIDARSRSKRLSDQLGKRSGLLDFVGASAPMRKAYEQLEEVAATDVPVFIAGESGTGKELAARAIHQLGRRAPGPFIAVNAAAIPRELMESELFGHERGAFTGATGLRRGCFELADGGTLLLDEIVEMPAELQPKLLRVLEDGKVRRLAGTSEHSFDVRLVAASNQEPRAAVASGRLRNDLFYRLNVFLLHLPPLRERTGDLPLLTQHFVSTFNKKHGTAVEGPAEEALELLESYSWPGNVRELRNVVERAVVLAKQGWIEPSHLPPYVRSGETASAGAPLSLPAGLTMAEAERRLILRTLEETGNNKAEAARRLGLDVKTIRNKLKSYGMA
jgi:DNA-binding NtrC family response regulator